MSEQRKPYADYVNTPSAERFGWIREALASLRMHADNDHGDSGCGCSWWPYEPILDSLEAEHSSNGRERP